MITTRESVRQAVARALVLAPGDTEAAIAVVAQALGLPENMQNDIEKIAQEARGYIRDGATAWDRENLHDCIDRLEAAALLGGLAKGDSVITGAGDVDQRVSVAAPGAQEVSAVSVNLGLHSPEHDLKPAVSALPHGAPPAREDYVRAAKIIALAYGRHDDAPAYLPRTENEAACFEPHPWVVLAMMQAYADGRASADGRMAAVPDLLACVRDLVGQITAFAEQHGEADFETGRATALLARLGA
ncbi:hypothetical protein [Aquabacterium sp. OR-4]|uniref:hypothetical protein n=1 Tax=Aquabacterium sp. OR-4 TaxID=2978127 RepID=UPI0021B48646|nr:hypothetical protein [Aquabacterium sp. OR-4]MDT7835007.1 hypothetical protein [Aquabacterium sp. OR-4]